jgi:hypothetical protein
MLGCRLDLTEKAVMMLERWFVTVREKLHKVLIQNSGLF